MQLVRMNYLHFILSFHFLLGYVQLPRGRHSSITFAPTNPVELQATQNLWLILDILFLFRRQHDCSGESEDNLTFAWLQVLLSESFLNLKSIVS